MFLLDASDFCYTTHDIWQFVGVFVTIFKIVIPILLIIFGSIDLGKAVVASDDKAIKGATTILVKRLIAAIIIFFIPTIVMWIFRAVSTYRSMENSINFRNCETCVLKPWDCDTSTVERNS